MKITLIGFPGIDEWKGVRQRALVTMGGWERAQGAEVPDSKWKHRILEARHSPIRYLVYSFVIEGIPSNIATHLVRHVFVLPYVQSLRCDRQNIIDGDKAPRDTPVDMMIDINAEELMVMANKRLCNRAYGKTRDVVAEMCRLATKVTPEFEGLLVPMCEYHGGVCHEMRPCGLHERKVD